MDIDRNVSLLFEGVFVKREVNKKDLSGF